LKEYAPVSQSDRHVTLTKEFFAALKHALKWNGRVFVNTSIYVAKDLASEFERNGFNVKMHPMNKVWDKIQAKPLSFDKISSNMGTQSFVARTVQLVVRKKNN
jgi:hypothetical protein